MTSGSEQPPAPQDRALEATREVFAHWNERGLDSFAERYWAESLVWEEPAGFPDAGTWHGREACVRRMRERLSLLGEVTVHVVDARLVRRHGDRTHTLIEIIVRGQGTSSGVPVEVRQFMLSEQRGPQVVNLREFLDRDAALAAAEEQRQG